MTKFLANLSGLLGRQLFNLLIIAGLALYLSPIDYAACMYSFSVAGLIATVFEYGYSITLPRLVASSPNWRQERCSIFHSKAPLYAITLTSSILAYIIIENPLLRFGNFFAWHSYICLNSLINLSILHYRGKNRPEIETKIIFSNNAISAILLLSITTITQSTTIGITVSSIYKVYLLAKLLRTSRPFARQTPQSRSSTLSLHLPDGLFVFLTMGVIHFENIAAGSQMSKVDFAHFNLTNNALLGTCMLGVAFSQYSVVRYSKHGTKLPQLAAESFKLLLTGVALSLSLIFLIHLDPGGIIPDFLKFDTTTLLLSIFCLKFSTSPITAYLTAKRLMRARSLTSLAYALTLVSVLSATQSPISINDMFTAIFAANVVLSGSSWLIIICKRD